MAYADPDGKLVAITIVGLVGTWGAVGVWDDPSSWPYAALGAALVGGALLAGALCSWWEGVDGGWGMQGDTLVHTAHRRGGRHVRILDQLDLTRVALAHTDHHHRLQLRGRDGHVLAHLDPTYDNDQDLKRQLHTALTRRGLHPSKARTVCDTALVAARARACLDAAWQRADQNGDTLRPATLPPAHRYARPLWAYPPRQP